MKPQPDRVERPLRKLRKLVTALPPNPPPQDVHSLRTQVRRLEAAFAALSLDRDKPARRLLKLITPVRKAAGKVRDMDVLIADVLTLAPQEGSESAVALIEHLARMRVRNARRLHRVVTAERKGIRKRLKQSSKLMRQTLKEGSAALDNQVAPRILITELSHWPNLDENNLHLFRIRTKELRYMLQLTPQADQKIVDALGGLKDAIGDWHDRVELLNIAEKVLDHRSEGDLLKRIQNTRDEKLHLALAAANHVRERFFSVPDGREASRKVLHMASGQ